MRLAWLAKRTAAAIRNVYSMEGRTHGARI